MKNSNLCKGLGRTALALAATVLLSACGGDLSDLEQYIAEVKARPAEPIPPIPPVKTYTPYVYEGIVGRDPFRPSTSEGTDETGQVDRQEPAERTNLQ